MRYYRVTAIAGVVALIATMAGLIYGISSHGGLDENSTPMLTALLSIVASTIPSFLGLLKIESVHKDIKNGVVEAKAKEGARQAIIEEQVVTRHGPASTLAMESLAQILKENHEILRRLEANDGRPGV